MMAALWGEYRSPRLLVLPFFPSLSASTAHSPSSPSPPPHPSPSPSPSHSNLPSPSSPPSPSPSQSPSRPLSLFPLHTPSSSPDVTRTKHMFAQEQACFSRHENWGPGLGTPRECWSEAPVFMPSKYEVFPTVRAPCCLNLEALRVAQPGEAGGGSTHLEHP